MRLLDLSSDAGHGESGHGEPGDGNDSAEPAHAEGLREVRLLDVPGEPNRPDELRELGIDEPA